MANITNVNANAFNYISTKLENEKLEADWRSRFCNSKGFPQKEEWMGLKKMQHIKKILEDPKNGRSLSVEDLKAIATVINYPKGGASEKETYLNFIADRCSSRSQLQRILFDGHVPVNFVDLPSLNEDATPVVTIGFWNCKAFMGTFKRQKMGKSLPESMYKAFCKTVCKAIFDNKIDVLFLVELKSNSDCSWDWLYLLKETLSCKNRYLLSNAKEYGDWDLRIESCGGQGTIGNRDEHFGVLYKKSLEIVIAEEKKEWNKAILKREINSYFGDVYRGFNKHFNPRDGLENFLNEKLTDPSGLTWIPDTKDENSRKILNKTKQENPPRKLMKCTLKAASFKCDFFVGHLPFADANTKSEKFEATKNKFFGVLASLKDKLGNDAEKGQLFCCDSNVHHKLGQYSFNKDELYLFFPNKLMTEKNKKTIEDIFGKAGEIKEKEQVHLENKKVEWILENIKTKTKYTKKMFYEKEKNALFDEIKKCAIFIWWRRNKYCLIDEKALKKIEVVNGEAFEEARTTLKKSYQQRKHIVDAIFQAMPWCTTKEDTLKNLKENKDERFAKLLYEQVKSFENNSPLRELVLSKCDDTEETKQKTIKKKIIKSFLPPFASNLMAKFMTIKEEKKLELVNNPTFGPNEKKCDGVKMTELQPTMISDNNNYVYDVMWANNYLKNRYVKGSFDVIELKSKDWWGQGTGNHLSDHHMIKATFKADLKENAKK
jgi:hypothetical protein